MAAPSWFGLGDSDAARARLSLTLKLRQKLARDQQSTSVLQRTRMNGPSQPPRRSRSSRAAGLLVEPVGEPRAARARHRRATSRSSSANVARAPLHHLLARRAAHGRRPRRRGRPARSGGARRRAARAASSACGAKRTASGPTASSSPTPSKTTHAARAAERDEAREPVDELAARRRTRPRGAG